jgi:hypothetical protein
MSLQRLQVSWVADDSCDMDDVFYELKRADRRACDI